MLVNDLVLLLTTLIASKIARDESLQRLFACREELLSNTEYMRLQGEYNAAINLCCKNPSDYKQMKELKNSYIKNRTRLLTSLKRVKEEIAGKMVYNVRTKMKLRTIFTQLHELDERTLFSEEFQALQYFLSTNGVVTPVDMLSKIGKMACRSGHSFETGVVSVLQAGGWTIVGTSINLETLPGEIDIVASPPGKPNLIYIIEVKMSFGDVINLYKKQKQVEAYIREKYADKPDYVFKTAYIFPEKIPGSLNSLSSKLWGMYLHRFASSLDPSLRIGPDGKVTFPEGENFSTKWPNLFNDFGTEVEKYAGIRSHFDDGVEIDSVYLYTVV